MQGRVTQYKSTQYKPRYHDRIGCGITGRVHTYIAPSRWHDHLCSCAERRPFQLVAHTEQRRMLDNILYASHVEERSIF